LIYIIIILISTIKYNAKTIKIKQLRLLPCITDDLFGVTGVFLDITGNRSGSGHQRHTVAEIWVIGIEIELIGLSKT